MTTNTDLNVDAIANAIARALARYQVITGCSWAQIEAELRRTTAIDSPWPHDGSGEEPGIPRFGADDPDA